MKPGRSPDERSGKDSGNEVDMEQSLNRYPDVILFAPESICSNVGSDIPLPNHARSCPKTRLYYISKVNRDALYV